MSKSDIESFAPPVVAGRNERFVGETFDFCSFGFGFAKAVYGFVLSDLEKQRMESAFVRPVVFVCRHYFDEVYESVVHDIVGFGLGNAFFNKVSFDVTF